MTSRTRRPFAIGWIVAAALLAARCGGSRTGPSGVSPSVVAVEPARGPASGGTGIRVSGDRFTAGAGVFVGGVPATDVVIESPTSIVARTGAHPPGGADVTVTVGGRNGTLPGAFTYEADVAPVIVGITARGTRPNEPENFADLDEQLTVTAVVEDPDTPADQLKFEWSAEAGAVAGNGPAITWRAPDEAKTPLDVAVTLTVTDPGSNQATKTLAVSLHNSRREVGDLARDFLLDFSDSSKPAASVVRNFSKSPRCERERDEEYDQIDQNRTLYRITSSSVGTPAVKVQFATRPCAYEPRDGDACAVVPATWDSVCRTSGPGCTPGRSDGLDHVTAVVEQSQWKLCASYFQSRVGTAARPSFVK